MTQDNVTIHVDAVAFYKFEDPLQALRNIEDRDAAVSEAAQVCVHRKAPCRSFVPGHRIGEANFDNCDRRWCATGFVERRLRKCCMTETKPGEFPLLF